ncbi:hypothetical protein Pcinc_026648 [Petrolisthes cinctipes]|uniref:Uncharacterized protein n=1 Tax=Petrolisthes cinctipes TaxID=88211 RepID=A0AAE1F6B0_PETCI|nr:hypothetical protein Pcinc_026648 [Petrolisthes cinctipes]
MEEWDKTQRVEWRTYGTQDIVKEQDGRVEAKKQSRGSNRCQQTVCMVPSVNMPHHYHHHHHLLSLTSTCLASHPPLTTHQSRCIRICQLVLNNNIFL